MNPNVIGIEANPVIFEVPEFENLMCSNPKLLDIHESMYIFEAIDDANLAKELLIEADLYVDQHSLIMLQHGKKHGFFEDYGFQTHKHLYLYCDFLIAFTLNGYDKDRWQMAKLQMKEHLVFTTTINEEKVFFVDRYNDQLVLGIAKAYNCEVHFLDLDKRGKKL